MRGWRAGEPCAAVRCLSPVEEVLLKKKKKKKKRETSSVTVAQVFAKLRLGH